MIKQKELMQNVEYSQGVARTILSFFSVVYMLIEYFSSDSFSISAIVVTSIYFAYCLFNLYHVKQYPGDHFYRRVTNLTADIAVLSYVLYSSSVTAIVLYPLLLWMVVGNGLRFGMRYLFFALGVAEVLFTSALLLNDNWDGHEKLIYSLSAGLVVLSLFYARLIQRLHHLNRTLEEKVEDRVQEIEYHYLHDSLTDLKNREALARDLQTNSFGGLFVVDIDEFHNYNDLYGMPVGNQILKKTADFLRDFAKERSYEVYRIYGDHFVLRQTSSYVSYPKLETDIELLFQKIEAFTIAIDIIEDEVELDITVGISLERDKALKKAEMALLYAKKHKMPYIAYSRLIDSSEESQELLVWRNEIKKALQSDNIIPLFQPIVNRNGEVMKYESLMRLRRVSNGIEELISPFYFLDIAFKSKQYDKLTLAMIDKSFKVIYENDYDISINLSFEDIINKKIVAVLKEKIETHKIGSKVIFEIVESSNIEDFTLVKEFIVEFRKLGVRFAIDDFGSGYSNFSHIFELAPDFLKIDGSLIKNIDKEQKSYLLVRAIVKLARHLHIETIAEFVSKKEIYDICYKLGVNYFQGYYFSPPIKEEALFPYGKNLSPVKQLPVAV